MSSSHFSFDRIAYRYDALHGYPPEVSRRIAEGLIHLSGQNHGSLEQFGAQMLELGVGTGRIALPLLAAGIDVTGVDVSSVMLASMREKLASLQPADASCPSGKLKVYLADVSALPFATGTFPTVIAVHVFHLVPKWRDALDEALRVLQPDGTFLIGQDTSDIEAIGHIYDQWEDIIGKLGLKVSHAGASGYPEVVRELRGRGLSVKETIVTSWLADTLPRAVLARVVDREWSKTWRVPDDIFAESSRLLIQWADQTYGEALDTPQTGKCSFKVAVVRSTV
jgi:ubiquinone/menaquinone biosynthesis C-methylase UbiE